MPDVYIPGTYVSEDQKFEITLGQADGSSIIKGDYKSTSAPEAGVTMLDDVIGRYHRVTGSNKSNDGMAPFAISFFAFQRPDPDRKYCIYESWTGVYNTDDTLTMEGVRSYVKSTGEINIENLQRQTFTRREAFFPGQP